MRLVAHASSVRQIPANRRRQLYSERSISRTNAPREPHLRSSACSPGLRLPQPQIARQARRGLDLQMRTNRLPVGLTSCGRPHAVAVLVQKLGNQEAVFHISMEVGKRPRLRSSFGTSHYLLHLRGPNLSIKSQVSIVKNIKEGT